MSFLRQAAGHGVVKPLPLGREEDHLAFRLSQGIHGLEEWLRLQDHPSPATVRDIVHHPMSVMGPVPQVVNPNVHQCLLLDPAQDTFVEGPGEDPSEEGNDIIPSQRQPTP